MKRFSLYLLILFVLLFGSCAPAPATVVVLPTAVNTPTVAVPTEVFHSLNILQIPAPALENNLIGEPTERLVYVYLPPSYSDTPNKHYPVLYYLPGYGDSTMIGFLLPNDMDALIESGTVKEMIIVVANGTNKLGGSFYVNSPVTGNWEDYIVNDVVGYVDSHFRTLAKVESRGIMGHSMGGFGALNIAMHRPDIFSAVYSMSPGLFDEKGLAESQIFNSEGLIKSFIEYDRKLSAVPLEEAQVKMLLAPQQFAFSYGVAFAPNPNNPPPYYDYPFTEVDGQLVRDDVIWKTWESGYGGIADETKQYKDNFLKLKGIVVDYGNSDEYSWIPKGCIYFGEQLSAAGIPVKVEGYDGTHQSNLRERVREHVLPFFSTLLKFE